MSSFFRSANEISSSEETSSDPGSPNEHEKDVDNDNPIFDRDQTNLDRVTTISVSTDNHAAVSGNAVVAEDAVGLPDIQRDLLLHASLHKNCLLEALEEYRQLSNGESYSLDHSDVQTLADEKFRFMLQQLEGYGFTPAGLNKPKYHESREQLRAGLDYLAQHSPKQDRVNSLRGVPESAASIAGDMRRLLLSPSPARALTPRIDGRRTVEAAAQALPSLLQPLIDLKILDDSRYMRDFEELEMIGKGGYGKVYRVKHRLDGEFYAVKKIAISPNRIRKVEEGGQQELEALLMEIKALARLDHPNIVRYHNSWLEFNTSGNSVPSFRHGAGSQLRLLESPQAVGGAEHDSSVDDNAACQRSNVPSKETSNEISTGFIAFEKSERTDADATTNLPNPRNRRQSVATLSSTWSKQSTIESADESIDGVESDDLPSTSQKDHSLDAESSGFGFDDSVASQTNTDELQLTLHLQMGLYPLSLLEYLAPSETRAVSARLSDGSSLSVRHCFHLPAALRLLLAILDGVMYLHREGMVHRDLKPGNIFLSVTDKQAHGCIDLSKCGYCDFASDQKQYYLHVRVGDLGLVTAMARSGLDKSSFSAATKAVGTDLYRPPGSPAAPTERLDIYSLGVIALELLWSFTTRMERHDTFGHLRQGRLPHNFVLTIGSHGEALSKCIIAMVHEDEAQRPTCEDVQYTLQRILKETE